MPGMMETVLNIGLNDAFGARTGRGVGRRAVRVGLLSTPDSMMFGKTVLLMDGDPVLQRGAGSSGKVDKGVSVRRGPGGERTCKALVQRYKDLVREHTGHDFPQHPREQLDLAIRAVFDSWNTDRASLRLSPAGAEDPPRSRHRRERGARWCSATLVGEQRNGGQRHQGPGVRSFPAPTATTWANAQGEDVVSGSTKHSP